MVLFAKCISGIKLYTRWKDYIVTYIRFYVCSTTLNEIMGQFLTLLCIL